MLPGPITERYTGALPAGNYAAVPGPPELGGGFLFDDVGDLGVNTIDECYLKPPISFGNRDNANGPIVGVGIAQDSPISEIDLWLGDVSQRNRIRVGVGRPWFGNTSQIDDANLTYPRGIPLPSDLTGVSPEAAGETAAQWAARNFVFDSTYVNNTTGGGTSASKGTADSIFPVRLELYRGSGQFPVPMRRAPYSADLLYQLVATPYARLWMITDGRATVDVSVLAQVSTTFISPLNNVRIIVRTHDPVMDTSVSSLFNRTKRRAATFTLDDQTIGGVAGASPGNWPTYKQTFVVPAAMYSVTVIGPNVAGAISMISRDV